ncbi:TIGR00730 family Rossman fold protein [Ancylomarina longa]|uniref:Cytokinin riboside 5'-monophosphate phosphoribohydrolase n=1 Tax=Ancylomarina longa TaxID=2487017 RepID=A0A434AV46_9BACT|nr:TIGR00730 family Rossman fold protein [Ancylomarina longa]RUT78236.1 TIGR00730 family Rossman fold protein [Ancylomarina longa]
MNICVFCSSSNFVGEIYFKEARDLGSAIGRGGHQLIYGGTNVGLMNELAKTAQSFGARVIGVIPESIKNKGIAADDLDELVVTSDMMERKKILQDKADAFIALPGGFGTLEELMEVITLKQLSYHQNPIVIVNTNGFYNPMYLQFEQAYDQGFADDNYRKLYKFVNSSQAALDYIYTNSSNSIPSKMD